jgi:aminopeptidase N
MPVAVRLWRVGAAIFAAAWFAAGCAGSPVKSTTPEPARPGSAGVGDRLFPLLGNGGYDVRHYLLDLRFARGLHRLEAAVTVVADATQALSRFDLDFDGNTVEAVTVDGLPAHWQRKGGELIVSPASPIAAGAAFRVAVDYGGLVERQSGDTYEPGWLGSGPELVLAPQPTAAHDIFPSSDHPSDKATFTVRLTVPRGLTAVANGDLSSREAGRTETTWQYDLREPMATELVQVAVGNFVVLRRPGPHGVGLRDVVPAGRAHQLEPALRRTAAQLTWLEGLVGPYPFDVYGLLAADIRGGFGLETQTLTLLGADDLAFGPRAATDELMVHELAHQWFGDSVSPRSWSDLWLNEGHATWYQLLYASEHGGRDFERAMRRAYTEANVLRAKDGPVALPKGGPGVFDLFTDNVYAGGALVLYALRQEVGDPVFRAIERTWVAENRGRSVSTADFIEHASQIAERDLGPFLRAWLYGNTVPPMPGRPDWQARAAPR